jgi:serine/threonine protein kinase
MFDIMLVNDSICLQFNATAPPTNASVEEKQAKKSSVIGIAVGGTVGGLVFIAAVVVAVYLIHRRATEPKGGVIVNAMDLVELQVHLPQEEGKLEMINAKDLEIGDQLGTGCYGTVYKGFWHPPDQKLKIPVSIKVLNESLSPKESKELQQEGMRMTASDPNVLRLLGVCCADNVSLVWQFCPFGCLLYFLRRQKKHLTAMALMTYSTQIAMAMDFLEKRGLVHGNLACRNVLVLKPNQVRITDYGLSNIVTKPVEGLPLAWMSPESIEMNIFSHQSDVWSFGITLWELMTFGGVPYRNKIGQDLLAILQAGERLQQPKTVTIEVFALMLQCWIIEAASRPCFEDIASELDTLKRDPARYVLTAYVDEAVPDDRSSTMRSMYADSMVMNGDYDVEYDPEVQRGLYEDPDAYEGFLHYEDPDQLRVPDSDDVEKSNGNVTGYENPASTLKQDGIDGDIAGYESAGSTLKQESASRDIAGYENPAETLKQEAVDGNIDAKATLGESVPLKGPYETLHTDTKEKLSIYEKPRHEQDNQGHDYDSAPVGIGSNGECIFDEPGYESIGQSSEELSRIGSRQDQHQFDSDTMQLHETSPGYEDPTTMISTTPSKQNGRLVHIRENESQVWQELYMANYCLNLFFPRDIQEKLLNRRY